jgi:glutathione S-transferase
MQGDSKASSSASAGAQTAAAAGEGGADDDGDGASLLSDDGAADGRLWFVGERISIADVAVADLVSWCCCIFAAVMGFKQGNVRCGCRLLDSRSALQMHQDRG